MNDISETYKIDDDMPMMKKNTSKHVRVRNTLEKLNINQSFFIPIEHEDVKKRRGTTASIRSIATVFGKENNITYTTRVSIEKGGYGLRIWRIQ